MCLMELVVDGTEKVHIIAPYEGLKSSLHLSLDLPDNNGWQDWGILLQIKYLERQGNPIFWQIMTPMLFPCLCCR